jgi:hypothetical protein
VKRKKDWILIAAVIAAALLLLLFGRMSRPTAVQAPVETGAPAVTEEAAGYTDFVRDSVRSYFEEYPAESYLMVTTGSGVYSPIPLNEDNAFRIAQQDGSENVIHIGKNSFYMESSNCDNQNCVEQGEVTLDNRDSRILFNMVICLPHGLSLELLTRSEAEARLLEMYAEAGEAAP